jgi:hypothetical protein
MAFIAICILVIAGLPLALWLRSKLLPKDSSQGPVALAISILAGFAISAFAASWSYGVFSIDSYPIIFSSIAAFTWVLLFLKGRQLLPDFFRDWKTSDIGLLIPVILSVYLARPYWSGLLSPVMRSGDGPDTTQNLMAAQSARTLGHNWFQQARYFNDFVGVDNLRSGVMELYRLPSFREQAGIDYLVYGTRWGLTVPYSQVLRIFGNHAVLWETGFVFLTSIMALSVVIFAASRLISNNRLIPILTSVAVIANTPFMVQFFNGGLSQGWAVASTSGFFLAGIILLNRLSQGEKIDLRPFISLFVLIWLGISVTYIDATIVLVLFSLIFMTLLLIFKREFVWNFFKVVLISGLVAAVSVPIFTFATGYTFDYRLKAATGTGIPSLIWPLPSEIMGLVDIFSTGANSRSPETFLLALIATVYLLFKIGQGLFRRRSTSWIAILALSTLITFVLGYILSITGRLATNYIYLKVSTYVAPMAIIAFFSLLDHSFNQSANIVKSRRPYFLVLPLLLVGLTVISSENANNNFIKMGKTIPYEFKEFLDSPEIQEELSRYNYMTPYITASNLLGVLGDTHWISKAPNDLILDKRLDIELRLICFNVDTSCKPTTPRIASPKLESFGLLVFEAPLTTRQFVAFTPKERFAQNFLAFGQTPQEIPARFIGGNPYYNKD